MKKVIIADPQDITRAGLQFLIQQLTDVQPKTASDKAALLDLLRDGGTTAVVMDYTLFDINSVTELQVLAQRYPSIEWLLFSDELSADFMRQAIVGSASLGIVMKGCSLAEIREALTFALSGRRYICQEATEILLTPPDDKVLDAHLTRTEKEILKDIALGFTTREIAEKRHSSFHTVNTHRKNIFRKIGVNNIHEATRYALRAGLIDSAEYYI